MGFAIYRWADLPRQIILNGTLSRTALRTNNAVVTFNYFSAGAPRPEPHSHPFDQLIMVISGQLNVEINHEVQILDAGCAVRVPSDVPHTAWPVAEAVLNVDVFAPVRADYLFLTSHQHDDFEAKLEEAKETTGFYGGS